jgi:hypothetical protein
MCVGGKKCKIGRQSKRGQIISNGYMSYQRKSNNLKYNNNNNNNNKPCSLGGGLKGLSNIDDHHFEKFYSVILQKLSNLQCTKKTSKISRTT